MQCQCITDFRAVGRVRLRYVGLEHPQRPPWPAPPRVPRRTPRRPPDDVRQNLGHQPGRLAGAPREVRLEHRLDRRDIRLGTSIIVLGLSVSQQRLRPKQLDHAVPRRRLLLERGVRQDHPLKQLLTRSSLIRHLIVLFGRWNDKLMFESSDPLAKPISSSAVSPRMGSSSNRPN